MLAPTSGFDLSIMAAVTWLQLHSFSLDFRRDFVPAVMLKYRTGEEIKKGDDVRFHGNSAKIGLVASDASDPDPEVVWYIKEFGGGVLVFDPAVSGRTFIPTDQLDEYEDLEFVSRAQM